MYDIGKNSRSWKHKNRIKKLWKNTQLVMADNKNNMQNVIIILYG